VIFYDETILQMVGVTLGYLVFKLLLKWCISTK